MAEKEKPSPARRDHFAQIQTRGMRPVSALAERRALIEEIENLEARLRRVRALTEESDGGGGYSEPATAFDAVGTDGKLGKVVRHSTYAAPTTYPTHSQVGAAAGDHSYNDGTNLYVRNTGGTIYTQLTKALIKMQGANTLTISEADLTANMSIREIDVCDGGIAKKMLVIASLPY